MLPVLRRSNQTICAVFHSLGANAVHACACEVNKDRCNALQQVMRASDSARALQPAVLTEAFLCVLSSCGGAGASIHNNMPKELIFPTEIRFVLL